ncbi:MAG: hypothetical protein M3R72_01295 [Bacteroidota bacterium]|nr:hypothetical protein [Bacteroidota bacterium]
MGKSNHQNSIKTSWLIKNAAVINDGKIIRTDVLISDGFIKKNGDVKPAVAYEIIDAGGLFLLPGIIDGQVHFLFI